MFGFFCKFAGQALFGQLAPHHTQWWLAAEASGPHSNRPAEEAGGSGLGLPALEAANLGLHRPVVGVVVD